MEQYFKLMKKAQISDSCMRSHGNPIRKSGRCLNSNFIWHWPLPNYSTCFSTCSGMHLLLFQTDVSCSTHPSNDKEFRNPNIQCYPSNWQDLQGKCNCCSVLTKWIMQDMIYRFTKPWCWPLHQPLKNLVPEDICNLRDQMWRDFSGQNPTHYKKNQERQT